MKRLTEDPAVPFKFELDLCMKKRPSVDNPDTNNDDK